MSTSIPPIVGVKPLLAKFMGQPIDLVDRFLLDQQSLTAAEKFSSYHDETHGNGGLPLQERYYRDLLPLQAPGPDEQYAFEVDLDRCTGCKACVTACHNLNGLEEGETWRQVGILQDPGAQRMQQTITTACHHCLEPSCAQGCPTLAYEKDPQTGVVRHLDDQCFGCQYCILKCPYDVPQYHPKKGIVRKCDMCVGRLQAHEAPACVQACPTQAIRIVLAETESIRMDPQSGLDLPGTPDSKYTLPTTRYVSQRKLSKSLLPADAYQVTPEHLHLPLVFMLVASQTAIGFWILHAIFGMGSRTASANGFPHRIFGLENIGLGLVLAALALSPLHLGRPWLAWKAVLNWRRSWLSREVIAFTALAGAAFLSATGAWMGFSPRNMSVTVWITAFAAAAACYASAMVYRDTPRLLWATPLTLARFALTAVACGDAAYLLARAATHASIWEFVALLPASQLAKLAVEIQVLRHWQDTEPNPLWKAACLLTDRLGRLWRTRVVAGLLGGVAAPLFLAWNPNSVGAAAAALIFIAAGELMARTLFFATAIAPRMPGGR